MTKKKTPSRAESIAAAHRRAQEKLQEMVPSALERLQELSKQTKNKTVAKKAKRLVDKYKGRK